MKVKQTPRDKEEAKLSKSLYAAEDALDKVSKEIAKAGDQWFLNPALKAKFDVVRANVQVEREKWRIFHGL